jgi:hypothetical protein
VARKRAWTASEKPRSVQDSIEDSPYLAAVIAAAATLCLTLILPPALVLPALTVVLVALALSLLAAPASRAPWGSAIKYLSAALAFIGFGVALLADPEHVLPILEGARRAPSP